MSLHWSKCFNAVRESNAPVWADVRAERSKKVVPAVKTMLIIVWEEK
jgi:hypothetical protein